MYEDIYKLCASIGKGQKFDFGMYDQYIKTPTIIQKMSELESKANPLYKALKKSGMHQIKRTPKGGIAKHYLPHSVGAYDVQEVITENDIFKGVIITVIVKGEVFVFKCGLMSAKNSTLTGTKAFAKFKKMCLQQGVELEDYAVDNGKEVKQQIEPPIIRVFHKYDLLRHVNHIDVNSSWGAFCGKEYPALFDIFANLREQDKMLGNLALGYCQSQYCSYRLSKLAKAGINGTNKFILDKVAKLWDNDFEIVGINTDGIWYRDNKEQGRLFHDEDEGHIIGQYKHDHIDCDFRGYSEGNYWYKENGIFHPVARGFYGYELKKPRSEWDEIDFDKAMRGGECMMRWDDKEGFIFDLKEIVNEKNLKS